MQTIPVALGDRSYEVLIGGGLLAATGSLVTARLQARRAAVVTDANVASHHLATVRASLLTAGLSPSEVVLTPGEATKCFAELARLSEALLAAGLERGDLVIALGGGVIGDLAGFAAAILRRGVRYVQVPTSLLAQVDSSVGGKTAINTPQGKNLVGAFHQPALVIADTAVLASLPEREMRAGYAEVVKYGLLGDRAFYDWLDENALRVLARDPSALARAVGTSVAMKAEIVARDETETGDRMLLNLGHTFGHALEAWTGYTSTLLHGEAVAIGMCLAFALSEEMGLAPPQTAARVKAHIRAAGLPTTIGEVRAAEPARVERLIAAMAQDKKVRDGRMTFILARDIGSAFVTREVPPDRLADFLARQIEAA
ncbi:MAG: 3-dehydroquinate synthase [Hyphomicrobiaceae bacterium]